MISTLALCAALLAPPRAGFCMCGGLKSESQAFEYAGVVFRGRPVDQRLLDNRQGMTFVYTFVVSDWAKGRGGDTIQVIANAACGMHFRLGRRVTVYGRYDAHGQMTASSCDFPSTDNRWKRGRLPRRTSSAGASR